MSDDPLAFSLNAAAGIRRILVERAQRSAAAGTASVTPSRDLGGDILALDGALDALAVDFPRHADIVVLRYFAGLSATDVAELLGRDPGVVRSDWRFARAWLLRRLGDG